MNINSIIFTVISALLGMTIVFIFLGILYLIMVLLSIRPHKFRIKKHLAGKKDKESGKALNIVKIHEKKDMQWLIAALSAYLEVESKTTTPTAIPWKHNSIDRNTARLIINKLQRDDLY